MTLSFKIENNTFKICSGFYHLNHKLKCTRDEFIYGIFDDEIETAKIDTGNDLNSAKQTFIQNELTQYLPQYRQALNLYKKFICLL